MGCTEPFQQIARTHFSLTALAVYELTHLQQGQDEGELDELHEYKEDAAEHPHIEVRDVAHSRHVLKG